MPVPRFSLVVIIFALLAVPAAFAAPSAPSGKVVLSSGWHIQSGCKIADKGDVISTAAYKTDGWFAATVPNTVIAALISAKADKVYQDPYYGENLMQIPGMNYKRGTVFSREPMPEDSPFRCAYWYRKEFNLPASDRGKQVWLNFGGINYRANIWLNGKLIADDQHVAGAYRTYEFNVTDVVQAGKQNVLAVEVYAPTEHDLAINWVDWNPAPADKNMGLWREVYLTTSGPVDLRYPQVISKVDNSLDRAELTVTAEVHNTTDHEVKGVVKGSIGTIHFSQPVDLQPNENKLVTFSPEGYTQLKIRSPKLWWPYQMGPQNLHALNIAFDMNGKVSDEQSVRFGIREVTSELTDKGYRLFRVNGKPILIRGGGWAPDMFLREDNARTDKELAYVRDLGLNTVRLEGKLETDHFYNRADEMGILIMPGWCCCDVWERWNSWQPGTLPVAVESLKSQVLRMRNHPSIFVWLNGSDNPPPAEVEQAYIDVLKKYNWPNPFVSSATARPTSVTGQSGVKMTGPYDWVPPEYWLNPENKLGGAWGYNTETSPGPAFPTVESLRKFIPRDQMWPISDTVLYHAGFGKFQQIEIMTDAMNQRYGKADSLEDFERKAQAISYEGERAMFEAYTRNKYTSTGVIQWMLNNAWPGIIWHLYDYYLDPAGGYFGAKKANEPLHVLYGYDDNSIYVTNSTYAPVKGLKVKVTVLNFDLTPKFSDEKSVDLSADGTAKAFEIPKLPDLSTTYFVKLELLNAAGKEIANNFYWLSTKADQYDWKKSTFYHTPATQHADVTMLDDLPTVDISVTPGRTERQGEDDITFVHVKNTSKSLAFMVHLRLVRGRADGTPIDPADNPGNATTLQPMASGGEEVLPIRWTDNYITLLPGESRELSATYATLDLGNATPVFAVDGWNIHPKTVTVHARRMAKNNE